MKNTLTIEPHALGWRATVTRGNHSATAFGTTRPEAILEAGKALEAVLLSEERQRAAGEHDRAKADFYEDSNKTP